jgi:hypothetical protein
MPRNNGKHLLIANSYTLLLVSLRLAGPGDSAIGLREPSAKSARTEEEARRWRAYLTLVEEEVPEEVVVYSPNCAKREFEVDDG